MPDGAAGGSRKRSPRVAGGSRKRSPRAGAPRWPGAIRWILIPLAMGAVLAAALLAEALVAGARDAAVHTSVLLESGDLTIEPEGARDGAPDAQVLLESGAVFSNPALMRVPGRAVARVELRGTAGAGTLRQAAQLVGADGPSDPQAVLLSRFLAQGGWPEAEPLGGPGRHGVVLGATLSGRLGLAVGDAIWIWAGDAPTEPIAPRAGARGGPLAPRASTRGWQGHVAGVLRTGVPELDAGRVWTGLASAQELLPVPPDERAEAATRIAVYLDRPADAAQWASAVRPTLLEGAEVLTWREVNPDALPWGPWQRAQSRIAWLVFAGVALAAAAGGIAAGLIGGSAAVRASHRDVAASAKRSELRNAWRLLGPGMLGLGLAAALYAVCWAVLRAAPVPAAVLFSRLGADLNPFGDLTASVAPAQRVSRSLELCLTGAGVYGAAAALCLAVAKRKRL
ncbi:MAG: hypothetical protein ACHQZQ_07190 [SAR324 cluster bacterium]